MAARVATEADYERVVGTIAAAFYDDPLWSWVFPDREARTEQQATMFGFYVESALPNGTVRVADDHASAAIVYTAPGKPELSKETEARIEPFLHGSARPACSGGPANPRALRGGGSERPALLLRELSRHQSRRTRAGPRDGPTRRGLRAGRRRKRADISGVDQPGQQPAL